MSSNLCCYLDSSLGDAAEVLVMSPSVLKREEYMFTFRAVFVGCCLGSIISASNMVSRGLNVFISLFVYLVFLLSSLYTLLISSLPMYQCTPPFFGYLNYSCNHNHTCLVFILFITNHASFALIRPCNYFSSFLSSLLPSLFHPFWLCHVSLTLI